MVFAETHCDEMAFEGGPCFLAGEEAFPEGLVRTARKHSLCDAGRFLRQHSPSMMKVASVCPVCVLRKTNL